MDVLSNALNFAGFLVLLDAQDFLNLSAYLAGKVDEFGEADNLVRGNEKRRNAWRFKYRPVIGITLLTIGNGIQLAMSIAK